MTFANFFVLTLYVQQVLGYSALKTGVTFVATAGRAVLWAGVAQWAATRFGPKLVGSGGNSAVTISRWHPRTPEPPGR